MTDQLLSNTTKLKPAVKKVNGRRLAQALKAGTMYPDVAAHLAYALEVGTVVASKLPAKWARMMTGATRGELAAVRRAHRRARQRTNGNGGSRVLYRHDVSDEIVDTIVDQVGVERLMAALDRATHPTINGR
jgi:hypothetical protein